MTGYLHRMYAESLGEFGSPRELPNSGGWILGRNIPGTDLMDGMGCYPLFACADWSRIHLDLRSLSQELVSLALVADPFGNYELDRLRRDFDICRQFKEHVVADLSRPIHTGVSKHHRYYSRRALRDVLVEICGNPLAFLDDWTSLYSGLTIRHGLTGLKAFSMASFAKQLAVPGMVMFRAVHGGQSVGFHLWFTQGVVGYSHLAAFSEAGYRLGAAYALCWSAMSHFAQELSPGIRWLDFGGSAGARDSNDGLGLYKRGWSKETRPTYFCGCVFDHARYNALAEASERVAAGYFPAYRAGELAGERLQRDHSNLPNHGQTGASRLDEGEPKP